MSLVAQWMRRAGSLDPRLVDAALALGLTGWALAEPGALSDVPRALVMVAMTAAIAWLRTSPLAVLALEIVGVALLTNSLKWPQGVAVLIAAYSAAYYSDRRLVVAALLIFASGWLWAFGDQVTIPTGLAPLVLVIPLWVTGSAMRRREQRIEASTERADRLEREREAALQTERARIARELHDVVTHSVSVMVMQTGAARQIMTKDERRLRGLLESVEANGRSALEELRRLLGLLADQDGDAPRSPQPGVTEIPSLIERVRQAGLPVELRIEGEPRVVSGGVAVAAYRIVQEALTNVLKHADAAPTSVLVHWTDSALELEILDRGAPREVAEHNGHAGRGLTGMRERVAMYGGTLDAHPRPENGYVVRARIPLETGHA